MGDIATMKLSIETYGLLEPIIVEKKGEEEYRLLCGERRIRATKELGRKMIEAKLYEDLDPVERKNVELEENIIRKPLNPVERSRAIRSLFNAMKAKYEHNLPGNLGRGFSQKDLGERLDMSQSKISTAMRIAEAADQDPTLEAIKNQREIMRRITDGGFIATTSMIMQQVEDSFVVESDPLTYIKDMPRNTLDLFILDFEKYGENLFADLYNKLHVGGSVLLFHPAVATGAIKSYALKAGFKTSKEPYVWHCGRENIYKMYTWLGKNREAPLRAIQAHCSKMRDERMLDSRSKPLALYEMFVRHNTESGGSVMIAPCFSVAGVKYCIESKRNVIGLAPNKILKDRAMIEETEK